jgi:hypothetical protein
MTSTEVDTLPKPSEALISLQKEQPTYSGDLTQVKKALSQTTLITMMAPLSGGVGRQMEWVRAVDPSLSTVATEMTRARRPYDWEFDRTAEDSIDIKSFNTAMEERALLHYGLTASGGAFGSRVNDVVGRHAIMHVGYDSFEHIDDQALRQMHNVFLIMTGQTYAVRMGLDRLTPQDAHLAAQVEYSLRSIEFARFNIRHDIHTFLQVHNTPESLVETARAISRLAHQNSRESLHTTHVEDTLGEMEAVLSEAKKRISVQ